MKTRVIFLVLFTMCFAMVAAAQDAATQPAEESSAPTSRPEGSFPRQRNFRSSRRFDRERRNPGDAASTPAAPTVLLDAVSARNIFLKGNQRPPPASTAGTSSVVQSGPYIASANQLVLTGVSLEDNVKVGFLEDEQAFTVARVQIGSPIANGKVVNMTLDALDYKDAGGKTIRVQVGFNLAGGDVWGVSGSSTGSTTQPASSSPRGPGESMEDYLRRRRAAEAGH
jgi:hypothetical protein